MKIDQIKPYSKNAKKHPEEQIKKIANSIKEFGFNQQIVVDKDNTIIVGHGRYEAAKLLGLEEVPVLQVDLTEERAKAYRLADNKLNESDWEMELVIEELKGLSEEMIDLTGFELSNLESLKIVDDPVDEWEHGFETEARSYRSIIIHFKNKASFEQFKEFTKQDISEKAKYIWIPPKK